MPKHSLAEFQEKILQESVCQHSVDGFGFSRSLPVTVLTEPSSLSSQEAQRGQKSSCNNPALHPAELHWHYLLWIPKSTTDFINCLDTGDMITSKPPLSSVSNLARAACLCTN